MPSQAKMQEIANRGLQDRFDPSTRAKFDEAVKRGLITLPDQPIERQRGQQAADNKESLVDKVIGGVDAAGSVARKIVADPISGITGIQASMLGGPKIGNVVRDVVSQGLGFDAQTEQGQKAEQAIGETLAPVGEKFQQAEKFLGNAAFEATGSPALAAAAETIPTLATEVLGFGLTKGALKTRNKVADASEQRGITRALEEAAPTTDQLKTTSRAIYKELDELGVTVDSQSFDNLVNKIGTQLKKEGLDVDNTPKSAKALKRLEEDAGRDMTLSELDTLRKVAKTAASSTDPSDARLGNLIIDSIDEFLDGAQNGALKGADGVDIGARYKAARDLYGRSKRSELLDKAVDKARNQASGFENGIRIQFRQIINNKKASKFFSKDELAEMQKVVNGSKSANLARLVGKLGFTDGQTSNIIGGALGAGAGGALAGGPGAVIVPLIGIASKRLAERLTKGNAKFANQVIRAGKDARKITQAYFQNTSPKLRNAEELSELLIRNDIDLSKLPDRPITKEAARIASERRASLAGGATSGSVVSQNQEE
jgi:hypothetical protein